MQWSAESAWGHMRHTRAPDDIPHPLAPAQWWAGRRPTESPWSAWTGSGGRPWNSKHSAWQPSAGHRRMPQHRPGHRLIPCRRIWLHAVPRCSNPFRSDPFRSNPFRSDPSRTAWFRWCRACHPASHMPRRRARSTVFGVVPAVHTVHPVTVMFLSHVLLLTITQAPACGCLVLCRPAIWLLLSMSKDSRTGRFLNVR